MNWRRACLVYQSPSGKPGEEQGTNTFDSTRDFAGRDWAAQKKEAASKPEKEIRTPKSVRPQKKLHHGKKGQWALVYL